MKKQPEIHKTAGILTDASHLTAIVKATQDVRGGVNRTFETGSEELPRQPSGKTGMQDVICLHVQRSGFEEPDDSADRQQTLLDED